MKTDQLQTPDTSSPRSEYIRLLCELHALMANGQEGTPEIRMLRTGMDMPGEQLSDAEIDQMHGLSADLYDLVDIPMQPSSPPTHLKMSPASVRLWNAYTEGSWDALLSELRTHNGQLGLAPLTILRAYAWARLNEKVPLLTFLRAAAHLALQTCAEQLALINTSVSATASELSMANTTRALRQMRDASRARRELIDMMPGTGSVDIRRSRS